MENKAILIEPGVYGYRICPQWLKNNFRLAVKYTCPRCHKQESECGTLQIHRKNRGCNGGLYTVLPLNHPKSNCDIDCRNCHGLLHANEYPNVKSK
jgi:hypothetical protein